MINAIVVRSSTRIPSSCIGAGVETSDSREESSRVDA